MDKKLGQYRQGDVFIQQVEAGAVARKEIPPTDEMQRIEPDGGRVILAYGEFTGHAHALKMEDAELYEEPQSKRRFLRIVRETDLNHEEHAKIHLFPGLYEVKQQREYTPDPNFNGWRSVAD